MPLFFLIAGASTWFALEFRTGREYVKEIIYRLLIPLISGILLLIPPQSYYENIQKISYSGTFMEFYPHFFDGIYPKGNLHWGHLWFLFYLFVFSLVSLKFFLKLKADDSKKFISKFANRFSKGYSIFLLAVPLAFIEIASMLWISEVKQNLSIYVWDEIRLPYFSKMRSLHRFQARLPPKQCIVRVPATALPEWGVPFGM